jgi:hypothetical protein
MYFSFQRECSLFSEGQLTSPLRTLERVAHPVPPLRRLRYSAYSVFRQLLHRRRITYVLRLQNNELRRKPTNLCGYFALQVSLAVKLNGLKASTMLAKLV